MEYGVEIAHVVAEGPYIYDEQTFSVKSDETASVDLTAVLANSMVTVSYTDAFRNYMSNFNAILHSAGGDYNFYGFRWRRCLFLRLSSLQGLKLKRRTQPRHQRLVLSLIYVYEKNIGVAIHALTAYPTHNTPSSPIKPNDWAIWHIFLFI
mgnify:CR=1 FL=1